MDHWEGALMSAHAGKIKASVGLSDSVYDRNTWSQFLTVSKEFHDSLDIDPIESWVLMKPVDKGEIRRKLAEKCIQEGLFHGYEERIEPALEWRMYHLQKTKSQKHKAGSSTSNQIPSSSGFGSVASHSNRNGGTARPAGIAQPTLDGKTGKMPYDPIRD